MALEHLSVEYARSTVVEYHPGTWCELLAWMHQRLPRLLGARRFARHTIHQKALDGATARIAATEKPSGKHFGVVEHDHVARVQARCELIDSGMNARAGAAIEVQQTR